MTWGPAGVFLLAAVDSAGVPIPVGVDLLVLAVAFESLPAGLMSAALATVGSALGCLFLFQLGRKGGEAYLDRRLERRGGIGRFRAWYQRYGLLTVFVPVLTPAPLPTKIFVLLAGAMNASRARFLMAVVVGRAIRYGGLAWLGASLGTASAEVLRDHGWLLAAAALSLFALLALILRLAERRRGQATIPSASHVSRESS